MKMITQERLKTAVTYDPSTGIFTRIDGRSTKPYASNSRYLTIEIDGRKYVAHRLAILYMTGIDLDGSGLEVDHINGLGQDNRICNLRVATKSQNQANSRLRADSATKIKGLSWDATAEKWLCQIRYSGNRVVKRFAPSMKEAATEWLEFVRQEIHASFANHGRI